MVMTCKAESEMEEAKGKVRARSAVTTEVVDGSKELCNQITKLMAALTRAEQGNHPVSAPNSPGDRGHGEDGWEHSYLPQLSQWLNWPGSDHLCSQLLCFK